MSNHGDRIVGGGLSVLQLLGRARPRRVWIVTGEDRTHPALPTMD
jgi:hypothetical protein